MVHGTAANWSGDGNDAGESTGGSRINGNYLGQHVDI